MEPIWSLGLMSGTSLDGVDAAWLRTDGHAIQEVGQGFMVPYPAGLREKIRLALGHKSITAEIRDIERRMTLFHAEVVKQALKRTSARHSFKVIGFHGQTLFHAPPVTWQIGDGRLLFQKVGIEVVYDFRTADVAHGGQGAPLVPVFHQAMVKEGAPVAVINVGGVANMTWICKGQPLIACDTGPGGALLDDWVRQRAGQLYDQDGRLGAQGTVNETILTHWLAHPYFARAAPKSLDRNDFAAFLKDMEGLSLTDGAATLTELTARSIAQAVNQMPEKPHNIYVTGGGRRNKRLMRRLAELAPCRVGPVEDLGWNGDWLEAHAFAYLAVRVKAGLPTSFPATTGVTRPVSGGRWVKAPRVIDAQ